MPRASIDDPWLYADAAAELAGVARRTWTTNALPGKPGAIPPAGRRHPQDGHPQWRRSVVEAYVADRARRRHAPAYAIHDRVIASIDGVRTAADIAATLGVHVRTVKRHLSGQCTCLTSVPSKR